MASACAMGPVHGRAFRHLNLPPVDVDLDVNRGVRPLFSTYTAITPLRH